MDVMCVFLWIMKRALVEARHTMSRDGDEIYKEKKKPKGKTVSASQLEPHSSTQSTSNDNNTK